jgi:CubicO group peptidase (beta-lactamase class C family)
MMMARACGLILLVLLPSLALGEEGKVEDEKLKQRLENLDKSVEDLRSFLHIPGISAAVVKDQKVIWSKGFGLADGENNIPVTPQTPYRIASLTKTFASTLLMQLVEQGKLNLDDPMSKFSSQFKDDTVKVRHVLSHTSEGTPGARYAYNGNRFATLDAVLQKVTGKPFRQLLAENILEKIGMTDSVPGQDAMSQNELLAAVGPEVAKRYEATLARLAKPYTLYGTDEIVLTGYPFRNISTSAGLVSTVIDLAKYDTALDRQVFLKKETQALAWTPMTANDGRKLPYGLGWFTQEYQGLKLIWHYGQWWQFSALILKVPERNLTLLLLANSDGLSTPFGLGGGDVLNSAFASTFLRLFVFEGQHGRPLPAPDWRLTGDAFKDHVAKLAKEAGGYAYTAESKAHFRMRQYLTTRANRARPEIKVDPKLYEAYVGTYSKGPEFTVKVAYDGKRLTWQRIGVQDGQTWVFDPEGLYPESETKYFEKVSQNRVSFEKDTAGKVTHILVRTGGPEQKLARVP